MKNDLEEDPFRLISRLNPESCSKTCWLLPPQTRSAFLLLLLFVAVVVASVIALPRPPPLPAHSCLQRHKHFAFPCTRSILCSTDVQAHKRVESKASYLLKPHRFEGGRSFVQPGRVQLCAAVWPLHWPGVNASSLNASVLFVRNAGSWFSACRFFCSCLIVFAVIFSFFLVLDLF